MINLLSKKLLHTLAIPQIYSFSNSSYDLMLIRHAQSEFNAACDEYAKQIGIDKLGWDQQMNVELFTQGVVFNEFFIDSKLSEKGVEQCSETKKTMQKIGIDLILVSPKIRTLQTCELVFGKQPKVPVVVKPILAQVCRFACDGIEKTSLKRKMFPQYNFSEVQTLGEDLYIHNISEERREQMEKYFKENNIREEAQKRKQLMKLMEKKIIYETDPELRQRVWNIKQMLLQYRKKYKKIAVVSHWYILTSLLSRKFGQDGANEDYDDIENCVPYFATLNNLLHVH